MDLSTYEVTRRAIRSRLLFRTEAEYFKAIGVTGETMRDRRDDREAVRGYFDALDRECRWQCDRGLATMMRRYVDASAAFRGEGFDWMERRQMASRKKFCRWLFRRGAARGVRMTVDEESRFSPKECDEELFSRLYPDGIEAGRTVDVVMLVLLTFGIVRPFDPRAARSRDISIEETTKAIGAMKELVRLLRDDTPQIGALKKPAIYDVVAGALERMSPEDYSPAAMWDMLNRIEDSCIVASSPQGSADSCMTFSGYSMPGIWVDDTDGGQSRFWIFPENRLMAFCYTCRGREWELSPMEFGFYDRVGGVDTPDTCVFVTWRGNEQMLDSDDGVMNSSEMVTTIFKTTTGAETGAIEAISFEPIPGPAPEWMDWREFRRLTPTDERHARFAGVIDEIYRPDGPRRVAFRNRAPFMTDLVEALIAVDPEYVYVTDYPDVPRHVIRPAKNDPELYFYKPADGTAEVTTLRDIAVSPEHPLYLLPRHGKTAEVMNGRKRRFIEACRNTRPDSQITIYHTRRHPRGILCFNDFSLTFALDDGGAEIISYGAVKITDRKDFFR